MLKNSKFSVMLAACDNFRAGAVEQLKVHGKNLDLPVFDKGYKEEPPEIAYQAIKEVLY
jgi:signal recognition particle receptor subunit alpha